MSEKKDPATSNDMFRLFYKLTRNLFFAYVIVVLLAVAAFIGYGYVLHAYYDKPELWDYLSSILI